MARSFPDAQRSCHGSRADAAYSAADQPHQLPPVGGGGSEQLTRGGETVAQLAVSDLHREHRVLHLGHHMIGPLDRLNCPLEMDPRIGGMGPKGSRGKRPARKLMALGKL